MNELQNCPKCNGKTSTYRHPYAKVWCTECGHVIYEEGQPRYIVEIKDTYEG